MSKLLEIVRTMRQEMQNYETKYEINIINMRYVIITIQKVVREIVIITPHGGLKWDEKHRKAKTQWKPRPPRVPPRPPRSAAGAATPTALCRGRRHAHRGPAHGCRCPNMSSPRRHTELPWAGVFAAKWKEGEECVETRARVHTTLSVTGRRALITAT